MQKRSSWIFKVFMVNGDEALMRERKLDVVESGRLISQLNGLSFVLRRQFGHENRQDHSRGILYSHAVAVTLTTDD
jgi:hypothetical protein